MQGYNLIVVLDEKTERLLMCKRLKEPYLGLSNFVGGKIEKGEDGMEAAYRELFEETAIPREAIDLVHLIDFYYRHDACYVETYVGRLKYPLVPEGTENTLYWSDFNHDFFDIHTYAGEGNIGHIVEHIRLAWDRLFGGNPS